MSAELKSLDNRYLKIKKYISDLLKDIPGESVEEKVKHLKNNHLIIYQKLIKALESLNSYKTKKALYVPKGAKTPIHYYVRFGRVPRNKISYNAIENKFENGVSAYRVKWNKKYDKWELMDDNLSEIGYNTLHGFIGDLKKPKSRRPIYLLQAEESGHVGFHDSEPLLNVKTIKVIKELDINNIILSSTIS